MGKSPQNLLVYSALMGAQVIFGISAVIGTIGLPSFHPLTFALVREANATLLLLLAAHFVSIYAGRAKGLLSGNIQDWKIIFISGLGIFMSQAFYIAGIKLSSAVAASVWQPSQPIITAGVCMMMGWEPYNFHRVLGILVAFLGCSIMVLGGGNVTGESLGGGGAGDYDDNRFSGAFSSLMGQVAFLINCFGSSLYVLASKRVLATGRYESVAVTAWSYLVATCIMAVFAVVLSWSKTMSTFLCHDCEGSVWRVPGSAVPALIWYIIMTSSSAYGLITWANKYASGSLVSGYTVVQPVASAILIQVLVTFGVYESCLVSVDGTRNLMLSTVRALSESVKPCLDEPDMYTAFGAVGVVTGLMVIISTEPTKDETSSFLYDEDDEELMELRMLDSSYLEDYDELGVSSIEGEE